MEVKFIYCNFSAISVQFHFSALFHAVLDCLGLKFHFHIKVYAHYNTAFFGKR